MLLDGCGEVGMEFWHGQGVRARGVHGGPLGGGDVVRDRLGHRYGSGRVPRRLFSSLHSDSEISLERRTPSLSSCRIRFGNGSVSYALVTISSRDNRPVLAGCPPTNASSP